MSNEGRGRLDNAIDRALRGMMQVDPAPGLRHRVAHRIEAPPRRTWMVPVSAAAAAVLLVVATFAFFRTPGVAPPSEPQVATVPSPPSTLHPSPMQTTPPSDLQLEAAPRSSAEPRPPRPSVSIFGAPTGRVSAANLFTAASNIGPEPPAEPPPPGIVVPLSPITIEPITVTPIQIRPVTVSPIRDPK